MDETQILSEEVEERPGLSGKTELVGWVMSRVERWRNTRDDEHLANWKKYYSIWRGEWDASLKGRDIERSKLISPATQQAVDSTVAEMAEAIFGRGTWFDISDDVDPQQRQMAEISRDALIKDFDRDGVPSAVREALLTGAIYGTGIAKRLVAEIENRDSMSAQSMAAGPPPSTVSVYWEAIPPYNFVIDSSAKNIEEALGCAHETIRPLHEIEAAQRAGEYENTQIGAMSGYVSTGLAKGPADSTLQVDPADGVYITEYHGKVPASMLFDEEETPDLMEGMELEEDDDLPEEMVEAIVTIANGGTLLKAVPNPFGDRGVVAYAHDKVPNTFWGRGVCEKTFNSQAALDAELRARIDALGLMTYPVLGADATRLPRNLNLKIQPGKVLLTNGRPSEVIEPITFGNLQPASFQQTGDLERMVSMAAGSYDPTTPASVNSRNETASGVSMGLGSMIKRAKLTMQNVDQDFLDPLVRKSLLAYRMLVPERYPIDTEFTVNSTMSIMAREFEQAQMTNLLAIIPQESPAHLIVLKAIVENYSGPSKDKLVAQIEAMMQPDPQKQQMDQAMQQLQFSAAQAELQKLQAEIAKLQAEAAAAMARAKKEMVLADLADDEMEIDAARVVIEERQTRVQEAQAALKNKELDVKRQDIQSRKKEKASGSKPRAK